MTHTSHTKSINQLGKIRNKNMLVKLLTKQKPSEQTTNNDSLKSVNHPIKW